MERTHFDDAPCPIARSLDILGDWWTPLILRECLYGVHRFDAMQTWLGIGRNILARRLILLVEQGVLEKRLYQARPKRYEYHLTEKGVDAAKVVLAMMAFGNRWCFDEPSIELRHRDTGRPVDPQLVDAHTGRPLDPLDVVAVPGPAFPGDEEVRRARFGEPGC